MNRQKNLGSMLLLALLLCILCGPLALASENGGDKGTIPPPAPDKIKIDYVKQEISGVNNTMEYSLKKDAAEWTTLYNNKLAITPEMMGNTVYIRFKETSVALASEAYPAVLPAPVTENKIQSETKNFSYDYYKNTLLTGQSGLYEVTTDAAMSKWSKVTNGTVSLSKLVSAGVDTIKVRHYADNKAARFASEAYEYKFYAPKKYQDSPSTYNYYYDGQSEVLLARFEKQLKGLEISYDKGKKWSKVSSNEVKLTAKLKNEAIEVWLRAPATAEETDRAPSHPLKFSFEKRPDKPDASALRIDLAEDTFQLTSTAFEYLPKGEKTWQYDPNLPKIKLGDAKSITIRVRAVLRSDTDIIPASLGVNITPPKRAATPKVSYNAKTSQITGVKAGMEYYVTDEKITDKNYIFPARGITVTAAMLDTDGSLNVNDDVNGPHWQGKTLHGKYLHVKIPADAQKNLRESLASISTFIPQRTGDMPQNRVYFDKKAESLIGMDNTMEYRLSTDTKWITGPAKGDVSVAAYLDKATADDTKVVVRLKGSGKGETAIMASRSLEIVIGQRGQAPQASFDFEAETLHGLFEDSELAQYQVSLDNKKWQTPTRASLPGLLPKYNKKEQGKTLYVRLIASDSAVATKPAEIALPCRPQTPAYKMEISDTTQDAILNFGGNHANLQIRRMGDTEWNTLQDNVDFSQGAYSVTDTATKFQLRIAPRADSNGKWTPASLPQNITVSRAKAPNVRADYRNLVFTGANEKMQYRIATREGDNINTYGDWIDIVFPDKKFKKLAIDFDAMSGRNVQFRTKATKNKPASLTTEPLLILEKNVDYPDVTIGYDYANELMLVEAGEEALEYMLRMNDPTKAKWVSVPKTGIKLTPILKDTTLYVKENGRAIIKFRYAAYGSGDEYIMPSESSPEYLILKRMNIPYALFYDYETETIGKLKANDIEYSTDNKKWHTIKKSTIKSNRTSFPATNKEQVIYLRRAFVRSGSPKGFASDPLLIRIPAAGAPPELNLDDIIDFEETGDDFAIRLDDAYELMIPDTTVSRYKDVWLSDLEDGLPLQKSGRVIYDGKKDVKLLIRYKGSNEQKYSPSQPLTLTIPKGKK